MKNEIEDRIHRIEDKITYIILVLVLIITSLTLFLFMSSSRNNTTPIVDFQSTIIPVPESQIEDIATPEKSTLNENENRTIQLVGSIVMLAEDKTYIKLNIKDKGTFSIGIKPETKILIGGNSATLDDIQPLSEAVLEVAPLNDAQMYDYLALSLTIAEEDEVSTQEQKNRSMERIKFFNN